MSIDRDGMERETGFETRDTHRTELPLRTDSTTSRMAWVEACASSPTMTESCIAVGMTR